MVVCAEIVQYISIALCVCNVCFYYYYSIFKNHISIVIMLDIQVPKQKK